MIISCNECDSSFAVDDNLIKETGSKVRCSKCNSIFVAYPETLATDEGDDLSLDDLDTSMAALEDDDESLEIEGMTDDLSDELELDLDDFDEALGEEDDLEAAGLADDSDDEFEIGLDGEDEAIDDELPDLGEFEDLAGLDDESFDLDDTEEGLDLEDDTESDDLDLELEGDQELNLDDLDLDEEDEAALEAEDMADSDDLDLGLDLDLDDEAEADALSEDLGLEMGLAEEPIDGEDVAAAGAEIEEADELDLSDLELELEDASASDDTADAVGDDLSLELDLEEEPTAEKEGAAAGAEIEDADELDLSDLEQIMDSEEPPAADAGAEAIEDLELDFDLDDEPAAPATDAGPAAGDNELDFSDLEQMLETDDAPAADSGGDELDLQFDLDEQPAAKGADAPATAGVSDGAQDGELLDIEKMLEGGDEPEEESEFDLESADEDLSLTMEAALEEAAQGVDDDLDLDFDIESELQEKEDLLDGGDVTGDALESNLLDADDAEFLDDAGIDDKSTQAGALTDDFATDDFAGTQEDFGTTGVLPIGEDGLPESALTARAKSRSKKPVLVVLLLLLLAVGVIIIPKALGIKIPYVSDIKIPYLSDLDLKIPYLSDWINPEAQDVAGNLRLTPMGKTISGNFVNTAKAGQLFVIRGQIMNEYDHPRSFVKVTGKLYQGGNKLVRKSTVYVGNVLSDSELTAMGMAAINNRMKNKFGDKKSNLKIKTGKMIPFMIVFDKLPKNLDEYTVEVASSSI